MLGRPRRIGKQAAGAPQQALPDQHFIGALPKTDRYAFGRVIGLQGMLQAAGGVFQAFVIAGQCDVGFGIKRVARMHQALQHGNRVGNPTPLTSRLPVQVPGLADIVAISTGQSAFYALKGDGTVWSWGTNNYGQLGNGNTSNTNTPATTPSAPFKAPR
jgi:hypothetical protein